MRKITLDKSHSGHLFVEVAENSLIADLGLGDEANLGTQRKDPGIITNT